MSPEDPVAVLFDLGGVLVDVATRDEGYSEMAGQLHDDLVRAGLSELSREQVEVDLRDGAAAYSAWKNAQSRMSHPKELSPAQFFELVTLDWPAPGAALVRANAVPLAAAFELATLKRPMKPEVPGLLEELSSRGIRLGVVCNCLSGEASRTELSRGGILEAFDVALYSGELGMRKPDPAFLELALCSLSCPPERAWVLGDTYDRDILAARRAGCAKAILVESGFGTGRRPRGIEADLVASSPAEITKLLS